MTRCCTKYSVKDLFSCVALAWHVALHTKRLKEIDLRVRGFVVAEIIGTNFQPIEINLCPTCRVLATTHHLLRNETSTSGTSLWNKAIVSFHICFWATLPSSDTTNFEGLT